VKTYGLTSKGRRETNQDSFYCGTIGEITVLAVADGMGGHAGGEIAGRLAIEAVTETLHSIASPSLALKDLLLRIFQAADSSIRKKREEKPDLDGMGSTLACLLVRGNSYAAGNIGDSRIYRVTDKGAVCLTRDHTLLQQYIDDFGLPVPDDIRQNGHILSKVVDGSGDKPDLFPEDKDVYTLEEDDLFICMTDGLVFNKYQNFEEYLYQAVFSNSTLDSLTGQLLNDAFERGSNDNCTVVAGSRMPEIRKKFVTKNSTIPGALGSVSGEAQRQKGTRFRLLRIGLLTAFILLLMLLWIRYYDGSVTDLLTRYQIIAEKNDSQESTTFSEDQNEGWPRGFTGLSVATPYYDGSKIMWYSAAGPLVDQYHLKVFQQGEMIYRDSTSNTSFILSDAHGYQNGEITMELYAAAGDSLFQPETHSRVTFNYQKNSE